MGRISGVGHIARRQVVIPIVAIKGVAQMRLFQVRGAADGVG